MDLKLFLEQLKKFFKAMTKQQRVLLFISILVLFAALAFLILSGSNIRYAPLFSNLNPKDTASITNYLDQKKIDYKLLDESTIEVPKEQVYKIRLDLISKGLPSGGVVGFEIFDKQNFGTTNFVENINYIRALEGELTRTINSIKEVSSSKINLAIPKPTIFTEREQLPKASVMLELYSPLTNRQVRAIQRLVAAAVPKLTYKNVTVVDSNGDLLSAKENGNELLASNELKYKNFIESEYQDKIKKMLLPMLGKSKFVAAVNVELDLSKTTKKILTYDPNSVVVSEQSKESNAVNLANGGTPGVVSNVGPQKQVKNKGSKKSTSNTTTNYDVGKTEIQTIEPLIKIKKVSASVVVDGKYLKSKRDKIKYVPRTKQEIELIRNTVMNVVGYDKKRGDSVSVSNMEFSKNPAKLGGGKAISVKDILSNYDIYRYAVAFLLIVLFYFLFLKKFIKNVSNAEPLSGSVSGKKRGVESAAGASGKSVKELEEEFASKLEREMPVDEKIIKSKVMEDKIREEADKNPEEVANLLKSMMSNKPKS